ncbi:MAG: hypothetical protein M3345_03395 [Actinomycetota bacterium]|nr:hypothetical protein [Actinomycetota bacterium]
MDRTNDLVLEPTEARSGSGAPPLKTFLLILAAVCLVAGALYLSLARERSTPTTAAESPSGEFALTDAEAIARFKELESLQLRAYRQRDLSFLDAVFTPETPMRAAAQREISQLLQKDAFTRTRFQTQDISVISNTHTEIILKQSVIVHPKFVDTKGRDITVNPVVDHRVVHWTLLRVGDRWLLHRALIVSAQSGREESK